MVLISKLLNQKEAASLRALIDEQAHRLLDELERCDLPAPRGTDAGTRSPRSRDET